jgi:hypothetical protein
MNKEFFFTFGANHDDRINGGLGNCYTVIQAENGGDAAAIMRSKRGNSWAFIYEDEEQAGVKRWRLKFVPFESMVALDVEGAG